MPVLILIGAFLILAFVMLVAVKVMSVRPCSRRELIFLSGLVLLACALGFSLGTTFQYHANHETRVVGFPLPVAFFRLEGDHWTDFVPSPFFQVGAVAADVLGTAAVAVLIFSVGRRLRFSNKQSD